MVVRPIMPPATEPMASTRNTRPMPGRLPSLSSMFAFAPRPRAVPRVEKKSPMKNTIR